MLQRVTAAYAKALRGKGAGTLRKYERFPCVQRMEIEGKETQDEIVKLGRGQSYKISVST